MPETEVGNTLATPWQRLWSTTPHTPRWRCHAATRAVEAPHPGRWPASQTMEATKTRRGQRAAPSRRKRGRAALETMSND
jgi:hypothetical protein